MVCSFQPYEGKEPYIFVSYSHKDGNRVYPILEHLERSGFRIWYDEGIEWGSEWPESIAEHLDGCTVCMAFISASSVESPNCRQEIRYALKQNKGLISVYLEETPLSKGMDMQLSSYQQTYPYQYANMEMFYERLEGTPLLQQCRRKPWEPGVTAGGTVPPTGVPPTGVPPTGVPPTGVPPTGVPPTGVPPVWTPAKKSNTKKWLPIAVGAGAALILLVVAIAPFIGNGRSAADDRPHTPSPTVQPTQGPSAAPNTSPDSILGTYSTVTYIYENEFIGIGCRLDAEWEVFDADEIAELNGTMIDAMTDETVTGLLETSGYAQPFYAQMEEGLVTANITVENLGLLYGSMLDELGYIQKSVDQIPAALESLGLTDITTEIGSLVFAGKEHVAVFISANLQDVEFYETMVCMKFGNYIANITAGSYFGDVTQDVLALFYSL